MLAILSPSATLATLTTLQIRPLPTPPRRHPELSPLFLNTPHRRDVPSGALPHLPRLQPEHVPLKTETIYPQVPSRSAKPNNSWRRLRQRRSSSRPRRLSELSRVSLPLAPGPLPFAPPRAQLKVPGPPTRMRDPRLRRRRTRGFTAPLTTAPINVVLRVTCSVISRVPGTRRRPSPVLGAAGISLRGLTPPRGMQAASAARRDVEPLVHSPQVAM